jgi:hypothetical protein
MKQVNMKQKRERMILRGILLLAVLFSFTLTAQAQL